MTAIIALGALFVLRDGFKMLENPVLRRKRLIIFGVFYSFVAIYVIAEVVTGNEPPLALLGLPIGLLCIRTFFRAASKIKVPPKD